MSTTGDLKARAAQLETQLAAFRALAENAIDGVVMTDVDGKLTYANRAAHELFGYDFDKQEMVGLPAAAGWPEDRVPFLLEVVSPAVFAGGWRGEAPQKRKDGSLFDAQMTTFAIFDDAGAPIGAANILRDITEQKRAEESVLTFRTLAENAPYGISLTRLEGNLEYTNRSMYDMLGYSYDNRELENVDLSIAFDEATSRRIADELMPQIIQTGRWQGEIRYVRKDKSTFDAMVSTFLLRDSAGRPIKIATLTVDISDRKRAEGIMQQEKEFSDAIINSLPGTFFMFDDQGVLVRWNKNFEEVAGISPEQLAHAGLADFFEEKDRELVVHEVQRVFVEGSAAFEANTRVKGGSGTAPYYFRGERVFVGGKVYLVGSGLDLTDRKRAEEALRASEEKFRSIVDSLPMGMHMYRIEPDGRLVFQGANPIADQLIGIDHSVLVGKSIEEAFPPLAETEVPVRYREAASTGKSWQTEQIAYEDDRIAGAFEVYAFQTSPNNMVAAFLNVTNRKQAEEERERLRQQIIEAQQRALQELSTPIIPIMDRIIVMPLIGSIDTMRSKDIMRTLLGGITDYRAKVVILDITGVPIVDSGVAGHLDKTIQAARLKGARTIITGVSDAVAETIVDLGIDWSEVETLRDLQTGLLTALNSLGVKLNY